MKDRKGFTIIELLAVITVLGLLVMIALPAINKELAKFRIRYYKQVENTVKVAGQDYVDDKRFSRPTKLLYSKVVKVNTLVEKNYMEQIKDYNKKACDDEADSYSYFVMVKTGDKKYEYQACIKCGNDEYYTDTSDTKFDLCNPAWLTNEYISYNGFSSSDEVLWVYYGSSEREIEEQVGIKYGITKKDNKGNTIVQIEDTSSKTIYPDNINELVSGNLDQIVTLRYTMPDGNVVTKKAGLFRYGVPSVTTTYTNGNSYSGKSAGAAYTHGADEWANSITLTVGYNETDKSKYSSFINTNHITKIEYYDSNTNSWNSYNCISSSKESCTVTLNSDYVGTMKYRLVDNYNHKTKETGIYSYKIDAGLPTSNLAITSGTQASGVYVTDVVLTLTKGDSLSGVGKYGIHTSENYNSKDTLTINSDGNKTYYGYVMDKAGNKKTSAGVTVNRDKEYVITLVTPKTNNPAGSTSTKATYGSDKLSSITVPGKRVSMTFYENGSGASISGSVTSWNTTVNLDYTFVGWYTSNDETGVKIAGPEATPNLLASTLYTNANKKWNKVVADNSVKLYSRFAELKYKMPKLTLAGHKCVWRTPEEGKTPENSAWVYTVASEYEYTFGLYNGAVIRDWYAECDPEVYAITYEYNGGTAPSSGVPNKYTYGVGATINGKPSLSGYEFNGWGTNASFANIAFTQKIGKTATGDKKFYAKWCQKCASVSNGTCTLSSTTAGTCSYTTTCNAGYRLSAGSGTRNPTCTICEKNTYSTGGSATTCTPCPDGYTTSGKGSKSKSACKITCAANTRVKEVDKKCTGTCSTGYSIGEHTVSAGGLSNPCGANTFTVAYKGNSNTGGSTASHTCKYDDTCTLASNGFVRSGYGFSGWKKNNSGNLLAVGDSIKNATTSGTVNYYAQWSACGKGYYSNGATCTKCSIGYYSTGTANAECTKCPDGYTTSSTGSNSKSKCTITCSANTRVTTADGKCTGTCSTGYSIGEHTVTAGNTSNECTANTYTVTLNKDGGSGGTSSVTATYGSAMPSATAPSKTGYTFKGYYTEKNGGGTQYYTASMASARTYNFTSNKTLYAYWASAVPGYYVTFSGHYYVWKKGSSCWDLTSCGIGSCDTIGVMGDFVNVTQATINPSNYNSSTGNYQYSSYYGYLKIADSTNEPSQPPTYSIGAGYKTALALNGYSKYRNYATNWCSGSTFDVVTDNGSIYVAIQWHDTSDSGADPERFYKLIKNRCGKDVTCKCNNGKTYNTSTHKCE